MTTLSLLKRLSTLLLILFLCFVKTVNAQQSPKIFLQMGHNDKITGLKFTPDMKYFVSTSMDASLKLWDLESGKEIRTISENTNRIRFLDLGSDGRTALIGDLSGTLRAWDVLTGRVIKTLSTKLGDAYIAAISPDMKTVFSKSNILANLIAFNFQSNTEKYTIERRGYMVVSVAISPDNKLGAVGSQARLLCYNISDGSMNWSTQIYENSQGQESFNSVVFSPDSRYIIAATHRYRQEGNEDKIKIYESRTGNLMREWRAGKKRSINKVDVSPDGRYIVSGGDDAYVKCWRFDTGELVWSEYNGGRYVSAVAFSPDGKYVLGGGPGGVIRLRDASTGKKLRDYLGTSSQVPNVVLTPDGEYAIAAQHHWEIPMWDLKTGRIHQLFKGHGYYRVSDVDISADGSKLVSGGDDDHVIVWDVNTGKALNTHHWHDNDVYNVCISPDGKWVASRGRDQNTILWDPKKNRYEKVMETKLLGNIMSMVDGPSRLITMYGSSFRIYDLLTDVEIKRQKLAASGSWFMSQNNSVVYGNSENVELLNMNTGQVDVFKGHTDYIYTGAFSSDGRILVTGGNDKTIRLWDIHSKRLIRTLTGHAGPVKQIRFLPDNRRLFSASVDGSLRLWDTATGKELAMMVKFDDNEWITITPEGYFVASEKGSQYISVRIGLDLYTIDNYFEQFYRPDMVARALAGEDISGAVSIGSYQSAPPRVEILNPAAGQQFSSRDVQVRLKITDQGGGIDEIRLYQNGKLISGQERGVKIKSRKGTSVQRNYYVSLLSGSNQFRAVALNRDRVESNPATLNIQLEAAQATADLFIIAVGINQYKNATYNLNYAKKDAESFVNYVVQKGMNIFSKIDPRAFFDEQADRPSIEAAFKGVAASAGPEDGFIFYYAGHGVMSEGSSDTPTDFYLIPHDVIKMYGRDELLQEKALSATQLKELCTTIPAQKQLIVLDACQSGGAVETFAVRGAAEEKAILQLARSAGVVVLASTGTEQFASEFDQLGHGVFTYALLKGMQGEADGGQAPDGKITVKELEAYLNDQIPALTEKYRGQSQYPNSFSRGMDFPVVVK